MADKNPGGASAVRLKKKLDSDEELNQRSPDKFRQAALELSQERGAGKDRDVSLDITDEDDKNAEHPGYRIHRFGMKDDDMRHRDMSYQEVAPRFKGKNKDDIKFDMREFLDEPELHAERGEDSVKVESAAKKYAKLRDMMQKKGK